MSFEIKFIFFAILSFILINIIIYCLIYFLEKTSVIKKSIKFWLATLFVALIQAISPQTDVMLSLVILSNVLVILCLNEIFLKNLNYKLNVKKYLLILLCVLAWVAIFSQIEINYKFQAMSAATCGYLILLFLDGLYYLFKYKKNVMTINHKMFAYMLIPYGIFNLITYAMYRTDESMIVPGYSIAFTFYIIASIFIPLQMISNITINKNLELEEIIISKTTQLQESNNKNQKLLNVLIHDVSNIMQNIYFKLSKLDEFNIPVINEISESIEQSLKKVIELIGSIKKIEAAKKYQIECGVYDLNLCLKELEDLYRDRYRSKNVELQIKQTDYKIDIVVDKSIFVYTVLSNLVSNALKFSYFGGIVSIEVELEEEFAVIIVEDSGVGINKERIYSNKSSIGTLGEMGSGLGLGLVEEYVNLFKGHFSIQSKPDRGTLAVVKVPRLP